MARKRRNTNGFMIKLKSILQNSNYKNIISLLPNNTGFIINDLTEFKSTVLAENFKHNNFDSFRRQLNLYSFLSKKTKQGHILYYNDKFNLNSSELLEIQKLPPPIPKQTYESEIMGLFGQLKQISSQQKEMIQQLNTLIELQNKMQKKIHSQFFDYLKMRIESKDKNEKLGKFCWSFYLHIQDKKYKKFIDKQLIRAIQTTQYAYDDDFFQKYCQQYTPKLEKPMLFTLFFENNFPLQDHFSYKKRCLSITNEDQDNDLNQSISNISAYFDI